MKKYLDFIGENKNTNDIISDIKDILLEIEDANLSINYFYLNNHKSAFPSDEFNNIRIEIFSDSYKSFIVNNDVIDSVYRLNHYLNIKGYDLYLTFDTSSVDKNDTSYKVRSINNFKDKYLSRLILSINFNNVLDENLNFFKSSDFKNRWGIESNLKVDDIYKYFDFFRDSLIQLEDDNLISKYQLQYLDKAVMSALQNINIKTDDIKVKIEEFTNFIKERASLRGSLGGDLSITTTITLPIKDITTEMSDIIDSVIFLKENGKDKGFECLLVPMSITPKTFEIILITKI